ncbi:MAG: dTDP-glucose 4,6-dehydratase [Verrucomicrobiae bacterium]|nr:dTDP-glucose 4,6-dehydratase [Verrucomicrobiae bacterium]
MKILVTGGAGFIGSNFIRHLLFQSKVENVVNLDLLTYAGNLDNLKDLEANPRYHFIHGNICDQSLVEKILLEHNISAIAHFAAESHVDRSIEGPEAFLNTNVIGTFRLLEAAKSYWKKLAQADAKIFRFLHVSTDEVFGSLQSNEPAFCETTSYAPNSPYSASKAASDHFVRAYFHTYQFPVLTTNCSNNYGPYQFPEKLIPLIILNALEQKPLPIYGDGLNVRDWLYVEDHCRAIYQVLQQGRLGETYNIGGLNEMTNLEIVKAICALLDRFSPASQSHEKLITFVPDRPGHDRRYAMNCEKIAQELGWRPQESFHTGLEKTVNWYLTHREWCEAITSGKYRRERLGLLT